MKLNPLTPAEFEMLEGIAREAVEKPDTGMDGFMIYMDPVTVLRIFVTAQTAMAAKELMLKNQARWRAKAFPKKPLCVVCQHPRESPAHREISHLVYHPFKAQER